MRVGYSREVITPRGSVPLAGFDLRKQPSTGVADDIFATALSIVSDSGNAFIICSFDLLGVPRSFCEETQSLISSELGIPPEYVWCAATHTHAAPSAVFARKSDDTKYISQIKAACLRACKNAVFNAAESNAEIGSGFINELASLRDMPREKSRCAMPVHLISFKTGAESISLIRFACHPTVLSEKNTLISRDLVGAADKFLGCGKRLFLNGACGDISTRYTRNGDAETELDRLGLIFAERVKAIKLVPNSMFGKAVRAKTASFALKTGQSLSAEQKKDLISAHELKKLQSADEAAGRESDSIMAVLSRPPKSNEAQREITIGAADFGSLILLALPFEVNSADGDKIERRLSQIASKPVFLACYALGYEGYLPSGKPIDADSSYQDVASAFAPNATVAVIDNAESLIKQIICGGEENE